MPYIWDGVLDYLVRNILSCTYDEANTNCGGLKEEERSIQPQVTVLLILHEAKNSAWLQEWNQIPEQYQIQLNPMWKTTQKVNQKWYWKMQSLVRGLFKLRILDYGCREVVSTNKQTNNNNKKGGGGGSLRTVDFDQRFQCILSWSQKLQIDWHWCSWNCLSV